MAGYLRARDLNPNDADLLADMGNLLIYVGQPKQAIDQVKEAIRLNPLHATWYVYYLGWAWTPGDKRPIMEMLEDDLEALRASVRRKRH